MKGNGDPQLGSACSPRARGRRLGPRLRIRGPPTPGHGLQRRLPLLAGSRRRRRGRPGSFLELFRHWHEVHSDEHRLHWLRKVASRRSIDQGRRRKLRRHVSLDDAPEPFSWMPATDPVVKRYIEQLLAKLPEAPRMIVILRYQEGLEPAEIADLLDMPLATVKSHLHRSLASLRRKLTFTAPEDSI